MRIDLSSLLKTGEHWIAENWPRRIQKNVNCENDHPVEGGYTFEAGTKEQMHVVAVSQTEKAV